MEDISEEIKMETLEHFMDGISSITSQDEYGQDRFHADANLATFKASSGQTSLNVEMKGLKRRLRNLEEEVGLLRAELRLIKRKFRDVNRDPSQGKYRQLIEKVVADALDNHRYWKTGTRGENNSNSKRKSRSGNGVGTPKQRNYMNRLTFNEMIGDDTDDGHDDDDDDEVDPLDVSTHLATVVGDDSDETSAYNQSRPRVSIQIKQEKRKSLIPIKPSLPKRNDVGGYEEEAKVQKAVNSFGRKGRSSDLEYKKQVCRRAKEIGPTAAGREFNLPESTVRGWKRKLVENGIQFDLTEPEVDFDTNNSGCVDEFKTEDSRASSPNRGLHGTKKSFVENTRTKKLPKRKYKQYDSTPELKMQACQRAREVGPTAAGRELNVPEGSIRHWLRFLTKSEQGLDSNNTESLTFEPLFGRNANPISPASSSGS